MTCPSCHGHGVFRVAYHDGSPADFAICLCDAGDPFRVKENNGCEHVPHYTIWALRHGIDPAHVLPMEVLLTDEELAARGVTEVSPETAINAIAAAARARSKGAR